MLETEDAPTTTWRPTGRTLKLALRDQYAAWHRLEDLARLITPTPVEIIERMVLATWLNPVTSDEVTDLRVLHDAVEAYHFYVGDYTATDIKEFLMPAYVDAEHVWQNLIHLSKGLMLEPARPEAPEGDTVADVHASDAWRENRRKLALEWFKGCMMRVEVLLRQDALFSGELPDLLPRDIVWWVRVNKAHEMLDDAYSVGASLYLDPNIPGSNFGNQGEVRFVGLALSKSVRHLIGELSQEGDDAKAAATVSCLDFMWGMLKGFIWAGMQSPEGFGLPRMYKAEPALWEEAKAALTNGFTALCNGPKGAARWSTHRSGQGEPAANTPTSDLVAAMERRISSESHPNARL